MQTELLHHSKIQNQMAPVPNRFTLVAASAEARTPLNAFDRALLRAGVGDTNLMRVSSILPPGARHVPSITLPKGGLIPIAYATINSKINRQTMAAAIAVGIPEDPEEAGVIMEWEDTRGKEEVENEVRRMVQDAFVYRQRKLKEIISTGIEHTVEECGAAFAAVVLWYDSLKGE